MHSSTELIFYSERHDSYQNNVRSLIIDCDISFKEVYDISYLFSLIDNPKTCIIMLINTQQHLTEIKNIMTSYNRHNIFIVYFNNIANDGFFDNFCSYENLEPLKAFLNYHLNNQNNCVYIQTHSLAHRLIRFEFENLEISKKYNGFKFLVDFCINCIYSNPSLSYIELLELVAQLNLTTFEIVEHAIRHMLLSTLKSSSRCRKLLCISSTQSPLSTKDLLNSLVKYLKSVI